MDDVMILLTLYMIPLGIIQLVSGLLMAFMEDHVETKMHFRYYLAGCVVYGLGLLGLGGLASMAGPGNVVGFFALAWFYLVAFGLSGYHFWILSLRSRRRNAPLPADAQPDAPVLT